jgi:hypothetical protein
MGDHEVVQCVLGMPGRGLRGESLRALLWLGDPQPPKTSTGNVHVKIGAGATLEVIPVETAYGCLVLGVVVPESLTPASVNAVMEALARVASPPHEDLKSQIS